LFAFDQVTEIVEVTKTITRLNDVLIEEVEQGSGYISPVATDIFTDVPISSWVQPELNEALLNAAAADVVIPLLSILNNR